MANHAAQQDIEEADKEVGDNLAAGLLCGDERRNALELVGHWRAAHIEPLHRTLGMLESICGQDTSTILVSRLKRIDTIINKLNRPGYHFNLITLRDIAGCRLIVPFAATAYCEGAFCASIRKVSGARRCKGQPGCRLTEA